MNIQTFAPSFTLAFCWALICILMGINPKNLPHKTKLFFVVSFIVLAVVNDMLREVLGSASYTTLIFFTLHIPTFLLFVKLTGCSVIKMCFMIMTALVFTSPTIIFGNFVKKALSTDSAAVLFVSNLISYILILALAFFLLRKSFCYLLEYADDRLFCLFSLVPFIYYIYALSMVNLDFSSLSSTAGYILRITPTAEVFLFYFLLALFCSNIKEKNELEIVKMAMSQEIVSSEERIALMNESQSKMAIYHHDTRHHLLAIDGLLSAQKFDQAKEYVENLCTSLDSFVAARFCENEIVNLLCSSFSSKAKKMGIDFKINVSLPDDIPISDIEMCSIISNGLENAFNAVSKFEGSNKTVSLYCGIRLGKLLIEIKNPYVGEVIIKNDIPVSALDSHGYGCRSIKNIVDSKKGICTFDADNGIFTLRIALPPMKHS